MVRTRFAPSPTGSLHLGNARIAALNWLFSRRNDGVFILRMEDTDAARNVSGAEAGIMEDLRWLGLDWDEGPDRADAGGFSGPNAPYRQSERQEIYLEFAEWLGAAGLAYPCYCTAEELEARRLEALQAGRPVHYDGRCRNLSTDEIEAYERQGRRPVVRFRVQDGPAVVVTDVVRGPISFERDEIGDFVLLRSDGRPTYNFAVVVDDALMEITHVIRGAGHLSNTPRQQLLFQALGQPVPAFAHVPTVLGPDGQKLSKRGGARALADYRAEGYHPDAVLNYLSLLAWSSPSGEEVLSRAQLIEQVSLDRVGSSDTIFDPAKLKWLSARHIERMRLDDLVAAVARHVDRQRFDLDDETLADIVATIRSRLSTFSDINELLPSFLPGSDAAAAPIMHDAVTDPANQQLLDAVRSALSILPDWTEEGIDGALRQGGRAVGARGRDLFIPLRRAATGRDHGPPLPAILRILGRTTTLQLLTPPSA